MEEELMDEDSTMVRMFGTLNILLSEESSKDTSPTSNTKRERLASQLTSFWLTLIARPKAQADFNNFLKMKIMDWRPGDVVESCTVIAQSPWTLTNAYDA